MRHIVGETRVAAKREAKVAARAPVAEVAKPAAVAVVEPKKAMKVNDRAIEAARMMGHKIARKRGRGGEHVNPLTPYQPPPGVLPNGVKPLAMDEALATGDGGFGGLMNWGGGIDTMFEEGIGFLGYSYLAQLTQRPEFRRMSERIGTEMTRKWIKLQVVAEVADPEEPAPIADGEAPDTDPLADEGEGPEAAAATAAEKANEEKDRVRTAVAAKKAAEKAERVKELEDAMRHFRIKDHFANIAEGDGWFGRYHLYVDLKSSRTLGHKPLSELVGTNEGRAELQTSIGNGSNETSRSKVRRGSIKAFRPVEPMWCYPATYEAANPLKENFYNPDTWYANGITIHRSRLLCFVGREVPDILKPAYAFGGLSLSQMAKPYVDNWLRTRQAVADLIESFSVSGVYTNMQGVLQDGGIEALKRIELFNVTRSNAGAMMLDKDTEEFFNVSTPLGTLDALQAQSQEQMSSVSGIPLVILLGITPQGLNASSEGEIRAFYDWIHAYQETFFRDHLQTVIHFIMLHLWGEIDEEITFEFEPLWSMTDKEATEIEKLEAETDQIRIDSGVLDPAEVRKALAAQPESRYADINPEDVPEPPEQPGMGGEDPFGGDGGGEGGGEGGGSEKGPADKAFDGASDEWNEGDHPRATDGKFGSGSGSKTSGGSKKPKSPSGDSPSTSGAASSVSVSKKLTPTEKAYLESYSGDEFLKLNQKLREGDTSAPAVLKLDSAIAKSTVTPGTKLYRGISKDGLKQLIGGDVIESGQILSDPGFLSTSTDRNIAGMNAIGGVVMEIEVGKNQYGLDMGSISRNKHEKEVVLPRNSQFKVLGLRAPKKIGDPIIVRVATHKEGSMAQDEDLMLAAMTEQDEEVVDDDATGALSDRLVELLNAGEEKKTFSYSDFVTALTEAIDKKDMPAVKKLFADNPEHKTKFEGLASEAGKKAISALTSEA